MDKLCNQNSLSAVVEDQTKIEGGLMLGADCYEKMATEKAEENVEMKWGKRKINGGGEKCRGGFSAGWNAARMPRWTKT